MFNKSAELYDIIYSFKDYEKEACCVKSVLENINPSICNLLDVACGTGKHDLYLSRYYKVDGIDISPEFVNIANANNPGGSYYCYDMTDFHLGKRYDAVICLFSSIGYVKSIENVKKTLLCFKEHLNEKGIIVLEPWFTPETWIAGTTHMITKETEHLKICRMNVSEVRGNISFFNFHYLVGSKSGVEHFTEYHELGLFSQKEMLESFKAVGLQVEYDPNGITGRGMYIARL